MSNTQVRSSVLTLGLASILTFDTAGQTTAGLRSLKKMTT